MKLVQAFGGTVHKADCYTIRGHHLYKTVAPELPDNEILAFLRARRYEYLCGACLRSLIQRKINPEGVVSTTRDAAGRP